MNLPDSLSQYIELNQALNDLRSKAYETEQRLRRVGKQIQVDGVPEEFTFTYQGATYRFLMDIEDFTGVYRFERIDRIEDLLDGDGNLQAETKAGVEVSSF